MCLKGKARSSKAGFYSAKITTADFYFKRVLAKSRGHLAAIEGGAESMMVLDAEHFAF